MYRYGFVALSVRMCVAGANKVEGTMSLCLGTNEILTSKHDIAALELIYRNRPLKKCVQAPPPCLSPAPARFSHFLLLNDFPCATISEPGTGYTELTFSAACKKAM